MPLNSVTKEQIYNRLVRRFVKHGFENTGQEGLAETVLAEQIAEEMYDLHRSSRADQWSIKYAVGQFLDIAAEPFGVTRKLERVAIDATRKNVYFENRGVSSVTVPAGTIITRDDGSARYTTTKAVLIAAGERGFVSVSASGPGSIYNVETGELVKHSLQNASLLVSNLLPIETGVDTENDDDFRRRAMHAWATSRSSSIEAIIVTMRALPNVADVIVENFKYGIGTVGIFIESTNPITGPALLAQAQAEAEAIMAGGTRAFVEYPEHLFLTLQIDIAPDTNFTVSSLGPPIKNAVTGYVNSLHRGESLIFSKLMAAILSVNGVLDAQVRDMYGGIYDIFKQTAINSRRISPANHPAKVYQKWVTALDAITVCAQDNG